MLQARMGSTRLPGKVLRDFNGVPMIEHIYNQVLPLSTEYNLHFVLSTSPDAADDTLVAWAYSKNLGVSRHHVDDIAGRMQQALQLNSDEALLRIWGDCVFICPDILQKMLSRFFSDKLDYMTNAGEGRNLPVGLDAEIYSASFLEKFNSTQDPFLREYPLQFVLRHAEVKSDFYRDPVAMPILNLTVDYPEDLTASKKIATALKKSNSSAFHYNDLYQLYKTQPDLFAQFSTAERQKEFKDKLTEWQNNKRG